MDPPIAAGPVETAGKATANWAEILSPTVGTLRRTSFGQYAPDVLDAVIKPASVPAYQKCGVRSVAEADYGPEHVFVADLGSTLGAMCLFAQEKTLDGKPIAAYSGPQSEGYTRPGKTFVRRGRFYVSIKGSNESFGGGKNAASLAAALLQKLPDASQPDPEIERLRALPMLGRIPGSDKYVPEKVFGFTSLPRAFSADYGCGEGALSIAHAAIHADKKSSETFEEVTKEAEKMGFTKASVAFGDRAWMFTASKKPTLYLVQVGEQLAVAELEGAELPTCEHIMRELVRVLR